MHWYPAHSRYDFLNEPHVLSNENLEDIESIDSGMANKSKKLLIPQPSKDKNNNM